MFLEGPALYSLLYGQDLPRTSGTFSGFLLVEPGQAKSTHCLTHQKPDITVMSFLGV